MVLLMRQETYMKVSQRKGTQRKHLSLSRETLRTLSSSHLAQVVGAGGVLCDSDGASMIANEPGCGTIPSPTSGYCDTETVHGHLSPIVF